MFVCNGDPITHEPTKAMMPARNCRGIRIVYNCTQVVSRTKTDRYWERRNKYLLQMISMCLSETQIVAF